MTLQAMFDQGIALHQQGNLADAERIYGEVLRQQPNHFGALHLLGVIAIDAGQPEQGINLIRKAIGLNANVAGAHSNLAKALLDLSRPQEALASLDEAIALEPGSAVAHNNRGKALLDLKRPEDALASFDQAIALEPDSAMLHNNRGKALLDLKRPEGALASFDNALSLERSFPEAWNNRAYALIALCCWKEVEEACRMALSLKPDFADAWTNLGFALNELERWDEAVVACRNAVRLMPGEFDAWNALGYALIALCCWEEAEEASRKALALKSDYREAWINLSRALDAQNRRVEASEAARRADALKPILRGQSDLFQANGRKLHEAINRLVTEAKTNWATFTLEVEQIRALHRIIMHELQLNPGEYRKKSVAIIKRPQLPPPCRDVPALMEEMCRYVNTNWTLRDSIHLGAFVLWRLAWIHPFDDGNGRIARAVCNAILCIKNASSLPAAESFVEALAEKRSAEYAEYITCLIHADETYSKTQNIGQATRRVEQWLDPLAREYLKA
jgi:tetratricopeptide (TPR) repeat protein